MANSPGFQPGKERSILSGETSLLAVVLYTVLVCMTAFATSVYAYEFGLNYGMKLGGNVVLMILLGGQHE